MADIGYQLALRTIGTLGLGLGLWQVNQLAGLAKFGPLPVSFLPTWSVPLFVSGIVVAGLCAAIMNALMPEEEAA